MNKLSKSKKIFFALMTTLISVCAAFIIAEIALRIFYPVGYLYPRYKYSSEYGTLLYENTRIEHYEPPTKRFYTTNKYGLRGAVIPIADSYDKKNIVLLGDSYVFGIGVNDGEEFASILAEKLKQEFNVINMGMGGWGLTQEIRRFYDFGRLYRPSLVVLMFSGNDPGDNLKNKVTIVENGKFKFQDSNNPVNWIKKYLSRSILQKSCVYNLIRIATYKFFKKRIIANTMPGKKDRPPGKTGKIPYIEEYYNELLVCFAGGLKQEGIGLLMISVNGISRGLKYSHLDIFPNIKKKVLELDLTGFLDYIEINDWFDSGADFRLSPVGHYDKRWHSIIGRHLSALILRKYHKGDNR